MAADSPILTLLLEDIKNHMDTQIEAAKNELEETKQLKIKVDARLTEIEPDRWSEYKTMSVASAAQTLRWLREPNAIRDRGLNSKMAAQLDIIAAEG